MKKLSLAMILIVIFSRPLQADGVMAYHKLKPGETIWFLSQVYYDDGNEYKKILAANHMLRPEDVVVDQELAIPNPTWLETMPEFQNHLQKLSKSRALALEKLKSKRSIASIKRKMPSPHPADGKSEK